MEQNTQINVLLAPAVDGEKLPEKTVAFIQTWIAMADLRDHYAKIVVDIENVYFLIYDLRTEELRDCFLGYIKNGYWRIELDRKKTWDKARVVESLLEVSETFDIEGRW